MAILCYVTDQIRKDAAIQGIPKSKLDDFAKEVEKKQSLAGFDHFPQPCLVKKKLFGFSNRMIAAEEFVGEHLVVIFLRMLIRGGHEYEALQQDASTWAQRSYSAAVDDVQLLKLSGF